MITSQLTGQVTEQLLPYILYKTRSTKLNKESKTLGFFAKIENDIEYQMKQEPYWVSFGRVSFLRLFFVKKLYPFNGGLLRCRCILQHLTGLFLL
jgi:anoctamin-10